MLLYGQMYRDILESFFADIDGLVEPMADEVYNFIKKYVPKHLLGEYKMFIGQTSIGLLGGTIEKCIELGTLVPPEKTPSAEGVVMIVDK